MTEMRRCLQAGHPHRASRATGDCGLDHHGQEDHAQLPDDQHERIDSGGLFCWETDEACAFDAQVRAYGALKDKKKFPWRYLWPDDVRYNVHARFLALNANRFEEEQVSGGMERTGPTTSTRSQQAYKPPQALEAPSR